MKKGFVFATALVLFLSGCTGDSLPRLDSGTEVSRTDAGFINVDGRRFPITDVTFEYEDGSRETRRYAILAFTEVFCLHGDCEESVRRYLRDLNRGEDSDY